MYYYLYKERPPELYVYVLILSKRTRVRGKEYNDNLMTYIELEP